MGNRNKTQEKHNKPLASNGQTVVHLSMELITPLQLTPSEVADRKRRLAWTDARDRAITAQLKGDAKAAQVAQAEMFELELNSEDWEAEG